MKKANTPESTIVDIARELNISPATVSRALNNHPKISSLTKTKVKAKAEAMGYRRNKLASGLRNNRTYTIGMIIPRISMYFHAEVITMIQNLLHKRGYNLIICQSNDSHELEVELAAALYSSRVDGMLVSSTLYTTEYSHFDIFVQKGIPLVFYDRVPVDFYPAQMVRGDDYRGGYLAATHLIETGCREIAGIFGLFSCSLYQGRYTGLADALKKHKLPLRKERMFFQELTLENARKSLRKLFAAKPFPDGLFAANDTTALAVLEFAQENDIQIPGELKLVGYSNDPRAAIVSPSITTIDQFPEEVARQAVASLMKLLENRSLKIEEALETITTPVALIRRMST